MTEIRVLFADDQLPYDQADGDAAVKQAILSEIGDKLRAANKDPEQTYSTDARWFRGLRQHLEERFKVVPARTFAEAKDALHRSTEFDVAVIDLSWSGDAQLPSGKRTNVGIELLEILQKQNSDHPGYKPVLAFSQNFANDAQLMGLVLDRGALPVPKIYSDTGYQALSSAISYLAKVRPPGSQTEDPTIAAARMNKSGAVVAAILSGILGVIGGVTAALITAYLSKAH